MAEAEVGVFGGSSFYSFVDVIDEVEVETPYGGPSAPIVIGDVGGRTRSRTAACSATSVRLRVYASRRLRPLSLNARISSVIPRDSPITPT